MRKFKLLFYLLYWSSLVSSQEINSKKILSLSQNMMMYRIHYLFEDSTLYCVDREPYFMEYVLNPDEEYQLNIFGYNLLSYPKSEVKLFVVDNNHYEKRLKGTDAVSHIYRTDSFGKDLFLSIEKRILIGVNENNGQLTYISGNVFKNCIKGDFDLNIKHPESFYTFLKFKLFNYQADKIEYVSTKKNHLLFKTKTPLLKNDNLIIKVSKSDFDNIQIKTEGGRTENGSYKWTKRGS